MNKTKKFNWLYIAAPLLLLLAFLRFRNSKKSVSIIQAITSNPTVITGLTSAYGLTAQRLEQISVFSDTIYNAFYKYRFGMFEDEDTAIETANLCKTNSEAACLSALYLQTFNKSLKADFKKYLTDGQLSQIKTSVFNSFN